MPLTYAFRLFLAEEFSTCVDFTAQEQNSINCVLSLQNGVGPTGGAGAVYDEASVLRLYSTGTYTGKEAIVEYLDIFSFGENPLSPYWNYCAVSIRLEKHCAPFLVLVSSPPIFLNPRVCPQLEDTSFLIFNEATDGYCDISIAGVYQAEINANTVLDEFASSPYIRFVQGDRIRYTYEPDLRSVTFVTHDVYYPDALIDESISRRSNSTVFAMNTCDTLENRCPAFWKLDNFTSQEECVARMDLLPIVTTNTRGLAVVDANSTSCRQLHSSLAQQRPEVHCPHISYFPEEDRDDMIKCSQSGNYAPGDFFSLGDLALFAGAARSDGLDPVEQLKGSLTEADLGTCQRSVFGESALISSRALPATYFCTQYLESQHATGENNTQYWMTLVGMLVGIRLLAMLLLRNKAGGN
jgi:hypothetical protein